VFDVTKRMSVRIAAVLAALTIVVVLGVTVLRPDPVEPVAAPKPLLDRVPGAVLPAAADVVLPTVEPNSPMPSPAVLSQLLKPLIAARTLGPGVSVDVLDPLTGEHLLSLGEKSAREPASTAKLLTAAAALSALGPQTTLATTVVSGARADQIVLVGGGDVMLAKGDGDPDEVNGRAGLRELARQCADALRSRGTSSVRLRLDDRLFTGPTRAPGWAGSDVDDGYVAPIQALAIDAGRVEKGHYGRRSGDPAMGAAKTFTDLLADQGIKVTGLVTRAAAPAKAAVLARVESAPVAGLVEFALTESDNTVAEVLGRLVAAVAGRPADFASVGPSVLARLGSLGVPITGAVLSDGSGLGDGSRVPAQTLTEVLALAAGTEQPELRPVLSGLPVAAVSGTLADRFSGSGQRGATGVVRAKTGTLTGVSSLAGTVVDSDGRLLVFAAMADQVKLTLAARRALDRFATTLAACGCR
jgi:serine-type D-Ala-D-Ala carboxypeptidase/endopeptidase (penicillin-binding protein 4)